MRDGPTPKLSCCLRKKKIISIDHKRSTCIPINLFIVWVFRGEYSLEKLNKWLCRAGHLTVAWLVRDKGTGPINMVRYDFPIRYFLNWRRCLRFFVKITMCDVRIIYKLWLHFGKWLKLDASVRSSHCEIIDSQVVIWWSKNSVVYFIYYILRSNDVGKE